MRLYKVREDDDDGMYICMNVHDYGVFFVHMTR